MGLFSRKSETDKALDYWCGDSKLSEKYKEKLAEHKKNHETNLYERKILEYEIKNDTLTIDNIESRLDELLEIDCKQLWDEFINKHKWYSSTIHSQKDLREYLKEQRIKAKKQKEIKNKYENENPTPKKDEGVLKFTCVIREQRYGLSTKEKQSSNQADGIIYNDRFEFTKKGVFLKSDLGERKVYYRNVISIDLDKSGYLHAMSNVNVRMRDGEIISLGATAKVCETIYTYLHEKWNNYQKNKETPTPVPVQKEEPKSSNADELLKYAELYEKGLLTKEEFDVKKKELL